MKLDIFDKKNDKTGSLELPEQFSEEVRVDLISSAVRILQSNSRQPYGSDPMAGKKSSAEISRRRHNYRGSYGQGISRVPRKILTRRGTRMFWVGAFAPGTVGGRRAHPPKATKKWLMKINKKENRKAIRSAMAATINKESVLSRGHRAPDNYPFLISKDFEAINKTNEVVKALLALNLQEELSRSSVKKIRAGKGKMRGRKFKKRVGPLLVVSTKDAPLMKSARNIPGVEVSDVKSLNAEILAPGTHPGRLTLYTESALGVLKSEKLFL